MDTQTGRIYRGEEEIEAARALFGPERIVPVSEEVAKAVEVGMAALDGLNRYERRRQRYGKTHKESGGR